MVDDDKGYSIRVKERNGGRLVLVFAGIMAAETLGLTEFPPPPDELGAASWQEVTQIYREVIIEVREVTFIDSTGIRLLVQMLRGKKGVSGHTLRIVDLDQVPGVKRVLELTGVDQLFD